MDKVISAIATANGVGGVAIIRLSGDGVLEIVEKMFKPLKKIQVKDFEPYKLYVGEIDGGGFTDFGMAVYFKAPKSYTGEDMVELHCHGGVAITQGILKHSFSLGAIPATRGEFTKRAFINGKLSLDSCEGLIDMINSESVAEVKVGYNLYREKLNKKVEELQAKLTYSLAEIDANIDYPEEDLTLSTTIQVKDVLTFVINEIDGLLANYNSGEKIKNGVKVAIVGEPNTGKSSLLNNLLNYEKAIVSSIPGTTRDVVEGSIEINGVKFNLFDTAGIRETDDYVENQGILRSEKLINSADVILYVYDLSSEKINKMSNTDKPYVNVYNKCDVSTKQVEDGIIISAKTGKNIDKLKEKLFNLAFSQGIDYNAQVITEQRHYNALKNAKESLLKALEVVDVMPLDLISEDIKEGWQYLGEITGKTASEEIIDEIFAKFCVGK